jgi:predicted nuclease of predicted toxin-antitoxin system
MSGFRFKACKGKNNATISGGMKFIVDAQLPYGVALFIRDSGFDAVHTNDLPDKERTTDNQIRALSQQEQRIVITKDADFMNTFTVSGIPEKLLIITTGNIRNHQLFAMLKRHWLTIIELFQTCRLVEMSNTNLIGY